MRILLFLFVLLPIAEIFVLIKVGSVIGPMVTIGLILLTAFIGAGLLKQQGYSTLARAKDKLNHGALPAHEMVEGIFLAVGGALLLTPGFITDTIGFCCLIPSVRHYFILWGSKHFTAMQMNSPFYQSAFMSEQVKREENKENQNAKNRIIDGEFDREE